MPIRALSRCFHTLLSEWRKGRIEAAYREQEWVLKRGLAVERRKFSLSVDSINELKLQAARAFAAAPWAKSTIRELLVERLLALRRTISGAKGTASQDEAA